MTESKKFDPKKRKKLNNPVRLEWLPPALIWRLVNSDSGSTFADIGAGTGYMTRAIADIAGPGVQIHALDIEPLMVEEMQQTLPKDGPVIAKLMKKDLLPFEDNSIEGAWMLTLYHELEPPEPLLAEIKRVLRPGGRLLIVDWEKNEEACEHGPPLHHRVALDRAGQQLTETGFTDIQTVSGFKFHYGIIARV